VNVIEHIGRVITGQSRIRELEEENRRLRAQLVHLNLTLGLLKTAVGRAERRAGDAV
jgi:hypothetical protein